MFIWELWVHTILFIKSVRSKELQVPWASYQIREIAGCACAGNAGNVFPCRRFQRKPLVSDPGMHHGTCVTHVPWCMSGSLTCGDRENVPGIPGARAPAILRIWQEAHCVSQKYTHIYINKTTYCSSTFKGNILPLDMTFANMCCLLYMMDFAGDRHYVFGLSGLKCGSFQCHMRLRGHFYIFWAKLLIVRDGLSKPNQHY